MKQSRDDDQVRAALGEVTAAARTPTTNLMPPIIEAVRSHGTEEEIVGALEAVFGRYVEQASV